MNWLDWSILAVIVFFVVEGWRKSFIDETLDFFSFLLAFFLSLRFYGEVGLWYQNVFRSPHSIATILGFITVWIVSEVLFFLLIKLYAYKIHLLAKVDKKLTNFSFIPAVLRGLVIISIFVLLVGTFPVQPTIKLAVQQSKIGSALFHQVSRFEEQFKEIFGGLSENSLRFFTIKPRSGETVILGFKTNDFKPDPKLEQQMIELVNKERTDRGLKPLVFEANLREVGSIHSADMLQRGYFSHYSPEGKNIADRAKENNIDYIVIGENLAYAPTLEQAHKGLMNSEGHRANILSEDYGRIGIGIQDGGVYGLMITQVFEN